jgi:hypothetical protein
VTQPVKIRATLTENSMADKERPGAGNMLKAPDAYRSIVNISSISWTRKTSGKDQMIMLTGTDRTARKSAPGDINDLVSSILR